MKTMHYITFTLVIVGAINWGLVGLFGFNLVESLGLPMGVVKVVYILVGLAGVYKLMMHRDNCKICSEEMKKKRK